MRILVLGGGGREHAIVTSLVASPVVTAVMVAPGNGGTAAIAENVLLAIEDGEAVAAFARDHDVDLVVIGPEAPLVAGVADSVRAAGIAAFGPGAEGARLEGSKEFAKELMRRHNIPTGASRAFTDLEPALAYLEEVGAPVVVKADGLAAGKGVTVAMDLSIARDAVRECFAGRFGEAGSTVLIEEYLVGPECSILAFTDGHTVLLMAPAQDHKRAYEDDQGPNTGGMGVYSPVPIVTPHEHAAMVAIMERTVEALAEEDIDYRGVLYGGFILTDDGPKVLEFNARFGDPETQVVLPRLKSDLAGAMLATAEGRLAEVDLEWSDEWAVSVVLASGGYPGDYDTDMPISGIDQAEQVP
ncbi:MAG: phosphoribosylamine--glycine ligase, partial [Coriobacteriia bacterium]|nr:phosphoribosylamine--glycine ligase [Coriobacteriia bacterium]